jgi:SAM-dependent methyltransferase
MIYLIIFLIFALILLLWQISQMISVISGAPTIYAKNKTIRKAFELAGLKQGQTVIDLGCGNAKSLIIAAKEYKAKGIGIEISPFYYLLSKIKVSLSGESKNTRIIFGRFQKAERYLKSANIVYLYLFEELLAKIEPWLFQTVKPGTKVVSVGFKFAKRKALSTKTDPVLYLYRK